MSTCLRAAPAGWGDWRTNNGTFASSCHGDKQYNMMEMTNTSLTLNQFDLTVHNSTQHVVQGHRKHFLSWRVRRGRGHAFGAHGVAWASCCSATAPPQCFFRVESRWLTDEAILPHTMRGLETLLNRNGNSKGKVPVWLNDFTFFYFLYRDETQAAILLNSCREQNNKKCIRQNDFSTLLCTVMQMH